MISIKEIIRWERLTGKHFAESDLRNVDELCALVYVTGEEQESYEVFKELFVKRPELFKKSVEEISTYLKNILQYIREDIGEEKGCEQQSFEEIASILIGGGIDAKYVLEELELDELGTMLKAIDGKRKERMENDRMWTFYQILPHIDARKIKGPRDILLFPWEHVEKRDDDLKEQEQEFLELQKKQKENG